MSKRYTMKMAYNLFKIFGLKRFSEVDLEDLQLNITREDMKHIRLFNCFELSSGGNKNTNKNRRDTKYYQFTKEPNYEKEEG